VFECAVLILESDEFLFIAFEDIDLILEVCNDDFLLVGFDLEWRVEVGGSLGVAHLIINTIKL
jgi:hypothetical protein